MIKMNKCTACGHSANTFYKFGLDMICPSCEQDLAIGLQELDNLIIFENIRQMAKEFIKNADIKKEVI
jgi:hypothetical protein